MKFLRTSWFPLFLGLLVLLAGLKPLLNTHQQLPTPSAYNAYANEWQPPDEATLPYDSNGYLVRYGKELFANTAVYLGPKGIVAQLTNGMNCQNCHLDAGTQLFANCLSAVAANFPRYRDRSGRVETIEFRINDCMVRSLNGKPLDSLSREMRAMVAYLKWLGKDVPQWVKPRGAGFELLPYLGRAADPKRGKEVYINNCQRCHGKNGEGLGSPDSIQWVYPPLWGPKSYNTGAGLYRLSQFAGFVKNNMPFGATYIEPRLTNEEAWDVAAFVNSQPRPVKVFKEDWPDISKKPVDYPYGPYPDHFSEKQHKYGPFGAIQKATRTPVVPGGLSIR